MLSANQGRLIRVTTMLIEGEFFREVARLVVMRRHEWLGVFSVNPRQEIWSQTRYGQTPHRDRMHARGAPRALDDIKNRLLEARPEGGRIFIDYEGAYMKDEAGTIVQFVRFRRRHH